MDNFSFAKSAFADILEVTKSINESEKVSTSRLIDIMHTKNLKLRDKKCDLKNEILQHRQNIKVLQNENQQLQTAVANEQKNNTTLMKKNQELQMELQHLHQRLDMQNQQLDIQQRNNAALIKKINMF